MYTEEGNSWELLKNKEWGNCGMLVYGESFQGIEEHHITSDSLKNDNESEIKHHAAFILEHCKYYWKVFHWKMLSNAVIII